MKPTFRMTFGYRGKIHVVHVYLWDVHPTTFANWGNGRWGCFQALDESDNGVYGELHFVKSRLRFDLIDHELFHLFAEVIWDNGETLTRKNEERMAEFKDRLSKIFIRELRKVYPEVEL